MKAKPEDRNVRITRDKIAMFLTSIVTDEHGNPLSFALVRDPREAMRYREPDAKKAATLLNAWLGLNTNTDLIPAVDRRDRKDRRRAAK